MKIILKITRAEMRNLFFSPVAWFLATIFVIQSAVFYTALVYKVTKWQEGYPDVLKNGGFGISLTDMIFLDRDAVFSNVMMNLYLFLPLLTMGVLSREISNGTIKLLYSSPIKTLHIVLGKYLSLMIFNLFLVGIIGFFMISSAFNIQNVDWRLLLSAVLGFYLLVCAYAAIGLFMSSLTTYPIISAIGTFLVIFILSRIQSLWQNIDFVRDLTYFLSLSGRTENMLEGLITTKDVIYFLVVIFMFVGFTLLKLRSVRESKPLYITAGKYLTIIIIGITAGYISSRQNFVQYFDVTETQRNTIHPRVQQIVKGLGDDVLEVTLYTNLLGLHRSFGDPAARNTYLTKLWEKYVRFKPDIQFKYEYYYDLSKEQIKFFPSGKSLKEIATNVAKMHDFDLSKYKTPEEMKKDIDLETESFALVMQLKYKGRTTFLRIYNDNKVWPDERHVAAALARLQNVQIPKILFATGNLERGVFVTGERGLSSSASQKGSRTSLINNGFDVDTISLVTHDIPQKINNIAALVLADPKTKMSQVKQRKIQEYIDKGGNLMILGEPKKEDMLNPLLQNLGLNFEKGILVDVSKNNPPDLHVPYLTHDAANLAEEDELMELKKGDLDTLKITTETVVPVRYKSGGSFKIKSLTQALPNVWLKKGILVRDSVPPVMNPAEGDYRINPFVTSVALTRQIQHKEQRIIVAGDADFISNKFEGGSFFGTALFSWLANNKYPIYGPTDPPKDGLMRITSTTASLLKVIYVWILPALLGLLGTIILIRRKRK